MRRILECRQSSGEQRCEDVAFRFLCGGGAWWLVRFWMRWPIGVWGNKRAMTEAKRKEREMKFLDHLEELRRALIYSGIAFVSGCFVVMSGIRFFSSLLLWPLQFALGSGVSLNPYTEHSLITTSPLAVFSVILYISVLGGFALSFPAILYFLGRFVAPGLTERELRILRPGCMMALMLFLVGASFAFFALIPASLKASIYFNHLLGLQNLWSADRYYSLLMWMTLGVGLSFEFPLLIVLLVYVGILDCLKLVSFRPYSVVVFLILSALITPSDPFTMLLLAIPMVVLYELAVIISRRVELKR